LVYFVVSHLNYLTEIDEIMEKTATSIKAAA